MCRSRESLATRLWHSETDIFTGETGVVYKGHLNTPAGRELIAIKTGKGIHILHGLIIITYREG